MHRWLLLVGLTACAVPPEPSSVPFDTADPGPWAPPGIDADGDDVEAPLDCDDTNPFVYPGATEACDGIDNDCDDEVDEDIPIRTHYADADMDGYGTANMQFTLQAACPPEGYSPFPNDCDDSDDQIHPAVTVQDQQRHPPLRDVPLGGSEFDRDPAFVGDGIDQDCDFVDLCFGDFDGDGVGAAWNDGTEPLLIRDNNLDCDDGSKGGTSAIDDDCDDSDAASFPGASEVPGDGLDQDCDGTELCFQDNDGDGYGTDVLVRSDDGLCGTPGTHTAAVGGDCDDAGGTGPSVNPAQPEICDGVDNDCDGDMDEVLSADAVTWYRDADGDGVGVRGETRQACGPPDGFSEVSGDCDDAEPDSYPGNAERCDGIDNDCDGEVDGPNAVDVVNIYEDQDGDGYGNPDAYSQACPTADASGWIVSKSLDCDDTDPNIGPCPSCGCANGAPPTSPLLLGLVALLNLKRRRYSWSSK